MNDESFRKYCDKFFDLSFEKLKDKKTDFDKKNLWFSLLVFSADNSEKKAEKIVSILEGKINFENFELDRDKRWAIVIRLNSLNHEKAEEFLEKEKEKDKSDRGEKMAAVSEASNIKNKAKYWNLFVSGKGKSLDFFRDSMQGFYWRNQKKELRGYVDLFFRNIREIFEKLVNYYAKIFFTNLFPLIYAEENTLKKAKIHLEEFKDSNELLVKDMKEGIDNLERALKILEKYKNGPDGI